MSVVPDFASLPEPLRQPTRQAWESYLDNAGTEGSAVPTDAALLAELPRVWACSGFVARSLVRYPGLLADLAAGDLHRSLAADELVATVTERLADAGDEADLGRRLRQLRRREMVRIAWRDIAGHAPLEETLRDLSELAVACIDGALERLYPWLCAARGTPCNSDGEPQRLVVLGMGKLGGGELNFSSDIDLIFSYAEDGETVGGRRPIENARFFQLLGQQLIKALDEATADGFVYRVDMRLRPNGSVGPLALSFDAMEAYYQRHGRTWERYAMVKARVVGGDRERGAELLDLLTPFVYRRYLDFSAIEALRELKQTIAAEVRRKGMEDNIKLGSGGIREVEFVVQAHQIIRGGRHPELRERNLLGVLRRLAASGFMPEHVVTQLDGAYRFLRTLENRIQQVDDRQLQSLPGDELDQARLALGMGCVDWSELMTALAGPRQAVAESFEQMFAAPQRDSVADDGGADSIAGGLQALWRDPAGQAEQGGETLRRAGFEDIDAALKRLTDLHQHRNLKAMSSAGRERLDRLIPLAIGAAAGGDAPDATLERLLRIIVAIGRRSAYLALLVENPLALAQLVRLCAASPWIADQVTRFPLLLDELIDPRTLFAPPRLAGLRQELDAMLATIDPLDQEAQMDTLRRFQHTNQLRVAAADVVGTLPLMVVSDHLTELAQVTLQGVLDGAWAQLTQRHGRPACELPDRDCDTGFAIIAYGKMGGIELGYGSDLDIIFVHAGTAGRTTDGDKPIDVSLFFARLAQRIVHITSTPTAAGRLYETDLRLRPSGNSGLLVTGLAALATYQREQAWTWEHQALVRARAVAGDVAVGAAFEAIRREILIREREPLQLAIEVREMREKMREHLGSKESGRFHLKQDRGGIADIEFLVQYGVLRWAHEHPALLQWTDNIRLLEALSTAGLLDKARAEDLAEAYRVFRAEVHRLTLAGRPTVVEDDAFHELRRVVTGQWQEWLGAE